MDKSFDLRACCHVDTNNQNDKFVGIKVENDKLMICFPLGYHLPTDNKDLRREIRKLLNVLAIFSKKEKNTQRGKKFVESQSFEFPILAFLDVIDYYIDKGCKYYTVVEKNYRSDTKGKINFKRTIKKEKGFINNGSLVYTRFQVEHKSPLDNALITNIHKYCVYQASIMIGWLYTNQDLPNPSINLNKRLFIEELNKYYRNSNNDRDKRLFKSMITMINYIDDQKVDESLCYGTDEFEYVWEKVIDKVFGISNKSDYLPRGEWKEKYGPNKDKKTSALVPDSIMIYNDKIYILDAKYYRYGVTCNNKHLPDSSSISKQLTYGEYIKGKHEGKEIYNAFLMPFDKEDNEFGINDYIVNVAEATLENDTNKDNYRTIQGIVIDVRELLLNYIGNSDNYKKLLAEAIEDQSL